MAEFGLTGALAIAIGMLCGGAVKGVVGLGLPIVAISIMSNFLSVPAALALVTIPSVLSNLYQLSRGGYVVAGLKRFWPLLVALALGLWWSAGLVPRVSAAMLYGVIGTIVVIFCATNYFVPHMRVDARTERWAGPLAGLIGGLTGGVSAVYGPPITLYLVALNRPKELFVGAIGLIWFCAAIPLTAAYAYHGVLTAELAVWSLAACVPALGGFLLGQWVRLRIDQETFRKVLLVALLLLGLNLIRRALF